MATTKEERLMLPVPYEQAYQRALTTIQAMAWTITMADESRRLIEATTTLSLASWGEKVTVQLMPTEGGTTVVISSAARLKTNMTARGRNRKNVEAVADQLRA